MGRPTKATADYFPHMTTHKKTMAIIEGRWGNDAYAFWFKLLECLGNANGHYIDCKRVDDWEFLYMNARVSEQLATDILNKLSDLDAIDRDLWVENRVIWSDNFVEGLRPLYQRRKQIPPNKPSFCNKNGEFFAQKPEQADISSNINPDTPPEIPTENDKEKKSRVEQSIVDKSPPYPHDFPTEKTGDDEDDRTANFKQVVGMLNKNICMVNNQVEVDMIGDWLETMSLKWITEAIRKAALAKAKNIGYVDKILQGWVSQYRYDEEPWSFDRHSSRDRPRTLMDRAAELLRECGESADDVEAQS